MKIGLQIPSFTWPGGPSQIAPTLARIGRAAEEAGFASLWVMDHFVQNVLSGSKKRCKLLIRCGREKLLRITVSTFSSPKRSTLLSPFQSRILPSWSVEGAKRKRFA